ncbi:MAG: hypothetical protein Q9M97_05860 [Candidatus Gracilibacteria bacterium]|nr:hypothetical protein [Candidatus Gracilibacteria bacterium]
MKGKKGYCNTIGFFNIGFSEIKNKNIYKIINYYDLIEKQKLSQAISYKYFTLGKDEIEKDYIKRYDEFKKTFNKNYNFNEKVEINLIDFKEIGTNKLSYTVIINYESGKLEKYEITSEVIEGMIEAIKTLSVKQIY